MNTQEVSERTKQRREAIVDLIEKNKSRLLPCPFCGDTPILERGWGDTLTNPEFCVKCDCMKLEYKNSYGNVNGVVCTPQFRNIELTIEKWNYRKTPPQNVKESAGQHPPTNA